MLCIPIVSSVLLCVLVLLGGDRRSGEKAVVESGKKLEMIFCGCCC